MVIDRLGCFLFSCTFLWLNSVGVDVTQTVFSYIALAYLQEDLYHIA